MTPDNAQHRVVILGGGFAGLYAARSLGHLDVQVTVIDRRNHHLFQPLLYQVATAALNPSEIASPIRSVLTGRNTRVLLAEVTSIDLTRKVVVLADGEVAFDSLIVATGATHSYFGHDEWELFAPGLKTIEDALKIRRRVLLAFENAEREADLEARKKLLTFIIVGGGPTGVELAGALAEIARQVLRDDFRSIDPSLARVVLVEGMSHLLTSYPSVLSVRARRDLERLGVEIRTDARVTGIDAEGVSIGGERLASRTVLWAAGVSASPLARALGAPLDKAGRVKVTPQLTVPGRSDVYVIGDLAALEQDGHLIPGIAPAAMQEGKHAALNIERALRGQPALPFHFFDRGMFSVIGRGRAVGILFGRFQITGFIAWMAWLFIHLLFLIGFRSRLVVMVNWAYAYVTSRRSARLITGDVAEPPRLPEPHVDAQPFSPSFLSK